MLSSAGQMVVTDALASVKPGESLRYGMVTVDYGADMVLKACDPYGCVETVVPNGSPAVLKPIPPTNRPRRIADCVYLDFLRAIVVSGGTEVWASAPFELSLQVSGVEIAKLTPLKAKYTLVGDIVDGKICRYHASMIGFERKGLSVGEGEALVRIIFRGEEAMVPGLAFYVTGLTLFTGDGGSVYYPVVEATVSKRNIAVRVTSKAAGEHGGRQPSSRLAFHPSFIMEL